MRTTLLVLSILTSLLMQGQDSLYTSSEIPPTPTSYASDGPVEIGTVFTVAVNGMITGVRYYTSASGNYVARIWNASQVKIAEKNFTSTGRGWQRIVFDPIPVVPGSEYTASIQPPKYYDSKSQGLAVPITKGNLTGIKGTHTDFEGTFPRNVYDKVSYMITPIFEAVHPLEVTAAFNDTLLSYPTDSIQLKGTVSGDGVTWEWNEYKDTAFAEPLFLPFHSTELNPWIKKMTQQGYKFVLTGKDKWGNVSQATTTISVVQPIMILLSDGTWITAGNIMVDPRDFTPPSQ